MKVIQNNKYFELVTEIKKHITEIKKKTSNKTWKNT